MAKEGSWIKRHPVWSVVIGVVLLFIIIGIFSGGSKENAQEDNQIVDTDNSNQENIKNEEETHQIGDRIILDKIAYTLNDVDVTYMIGNEYLNKQPDGVFYIVSLTVENIDNQAKDFFIPDFKITDDKDREYSNDREADFYLETSGYKSFIFEQLQPSLPKKGSVAFDLPKDAKGLKLEITGGLLSSGKIVVDLGV